MGNGFKLDWKLQENIRNNKVCSTCYYGGTLSDSSETSLCIYDFYNNHSIEHPDLIPRIKTCLKWRDCNE